MKAGDSGSLLRLLWHLALKGWKLGWALWTPLKLLLWLQAPRPAFQVLKARLQPCQPLLQVHRSPYYPATLRGPYPYLRAFVRASPLPRMPSPSPSPLYTPPSYFYLLPQTTLSVNWSNLEGLSYCLKQGCREWEQEVTQPFSPSLPFSALLYCLAKPMRVGGSEGAYCDREGQEVFWNWGWGRGGKQNKIC